VITWAVVGSAGEWTIKNHFSKWNSGMVSRHLSCGQARDKALFKGYRTKVFASRRRLRFDILLWDVIYVSALST